MTAVECPHCGDHMRCVAVVGPGSEYWQCTGCGEYIVTWALRYP